MKLTPKIYSSFVFECNINAIFICIYCDCLTTSFLCLLLFSVVFRTADTYIAANEPIGFQSTIEFYIENRRNSLNSTCIRRYCCSGFLLVNTRNDCIGFTRIHWRSFKMRSINSIRMKRKFMNELLCP